MKKYSFFVQEGTQSLVGALNLDKEEVEEVEEGEEAVKWNNNSGALCPTPAPHISAHLHISPLIFM